MLDVLLNPIIGGTIPERPPSSLLGSLETRPPTTPQTLLGLFVGITSLVSTADVITSLASTSH